MKKYKTISATQSRLSEDKIQDKLHTKSPIDRFFTDIQLFLGLLKDYYYGNYRKIPYKSIASIVTALLYLINPIDLFLLSDRLMMR